MSKQKTKSKSNGKMITWKSVLVETKKIKPTPNNYKLKTDLGKQRLQKSLSLFGLAGNVICNQDFTLIDGNSRLEQALENGEKKIWVSVPNRKLSPKEFQEMSSMYDFAKAGEVDINRIQKELGTTADWYKKWNIETPLAVLAKMGNGNTDEYVEEGVITAKPTKGKKGAQPVVSSIRMVQLFFDEQQEKEFRIMEERLKKKFKVETTTDVVWKALKSIK